MTEIVRLALVEFLIKHKAKTDWSLPDGSIHQNPNKPPKPGKTESEIKDMGVEP
jgi:hypothetical protein